MQQFTKPPFKVVMIIDDSTLDHYVIEKLFQKVNFCRHLLSFLSGMEALDYLQKYRDVKEKFPDLIFVDINMPVMSGFDFLDVFENIAAKTGCYRVIVFSSTVTPEEVKKASSHPCVTRFVEKPLTWKKVYELAAAKDSETGTANLE
jgi:CheY-like chemotaxis protein